MQTDRFITASSLITRNKIFRNDELIFEKSGRAALFLDEGYAASGLSYPKFHKMDNLCKLGFLAAEILLKETGHAKKYGDTDTGLVLSNSHASLDVDSKYVKTIQTGASPALFVYTLPNIVIGEIAIRHHLKGENAFFVFKHFDGNFIADYVNGLFQNGLIGCCICGWVDIFQEDYRAQLFLIEKSRGKNAMNFTADNLNKLNLQENG